VLPDSPKPNQGPMGATGVVVDVVARIRSLLVVKNVSTVKKKEWKNIPRCARVGPAQEAEEITL
jgi:hypothetical protein